jgi:DNA-directed RNA polymerase specialized sigma24 family protein
VASEGEGSVTRWVDALKAGDGSAARRLWGRYFGGLVRLARARLRDAPRAAADEEDVALSAFHSLCAGAADGRFGRLGGRDELWKLLVTITARKAIDLSAHQRRQRRGGGRVVGEGALAGPDPDEPGGGLDLFAGQEPTPEFAAMVAEECRRLLDGLRDEALRQVALLRMEGYTGDEIAERLGCTRRTVTRKLELIRLSWQGDEPR